jgi:plastocyanin
MRLGRLALVTVALALPFAAACGGDDSASSSSSEPGVVVVKDNSFTPKTTSVAVGDTVTWRFEGKSAHNVTFDDFNSQLMKTGTFKHTFDTAGTCKYHCTIHSGMTGTIAVTEGDTASTAP